MTIGEESSWNDYVIDDDAKLMPILLSTAVMGGTATAFGAASLSSNINRSYWITHLMFLAIKN